jgi:hypothetical protein
MSTKWTREQLQRMAAGAARIGLGELQRPPLDVAIERELRLGRLQRLIAKPVSELALALGDDGPKVIALVELLDVYRRRREVGYFRMGGGVGRGR